MSKHSEAHEGSTSLCEALERELASLRSGIARSESSSCSFSQAGHGSFAQVVNHKKRSPGLTVYFRCPPGFVQTNVSPAIPIIRREKTKPGWPQSFPAHFELANQGDVTAAARFLIEIAYPVSLGQFRTVKRPPEFIPEQLIPGTTYHEGAAVSIVVNRYERDPKAREACLAFYGRSCSVCGFKFAEFYGDSMERLIEVHHLCPLSTIGKDYEIDPVKDMRPICPNCHAVLHQTEPPMRLQDAKDLIRRCSGVEATKPRRNRSDHRG